MKAHDPTLYSKDQRVIACSVPDCTTTRTGAPLGDVLRAGWGIDDSAWLCPAHLQARDAPHVAKAEAELAAAAEAEKHADAEKKAEE